VWLNHGGLAWGGAIYLHAHLVTERSQTNRTVVDSPWPILPNRFGAQSKRLARKARRIIIGQHDIGATHAASFLRAALRSQRSAPTVLSALRGRSGNRRQCTLSGSLSGGVR
jgi:hypothetical protein